MPLKTGILVADMQPQKKHYQELVQSKSKTRFASCGYCDRFDPFHLSLNERIVKLYRTVFERNLSQVQSKRLLDIGCGTGIYFKLLAEYADEILALDISEDMVAVAKDFCKQNQLNNIHPDVGSAVKIPFDNQMFDTVISLDVLHHIEKLDDVVDEVYRVLKPGGYFFVFEPNILNPLMFFAHLLPKEKRLALNISRPGKLKALLHNRFKPVQWEGVCQLITQLKGVRGSIIDIYLQFWILLGIKPLFPRQTLLVRKA